MTVSDNSQNSKYPRHLSDSHTNQIEVLKCMTLGTTESDVKCLDINEIAERSGLKDEKEVQRYLFILEGQKLVSPHPEGDFTSRVWQITKNGMQTVRKVARAEVQQ